ncbi:conserved membrane hypothetical protein [Hyella patelloides LEGE 07179]|uniref:O-antigen polymerase n=1 Tax=Hyella patelloides LEGE 07179 TaxID=945734 RepID=A0A563VX90_9CYAN|nr:hypothetical protein [Hyella patelloides]VEP16062.1 conserved membrane hypothetical protein [Hyella patelloides LEGE 07179]
MNTKPSEIFWNIVDWYQNARFRGEIPFWIVYAIAVYLPFEELILKLIPAPSIIILFLRFLHELVLYYLWGRVFYKRLLRGDRLIKSSIELAFICFVFWAIILLLIHQASIFSGLDNLRTLIRYFAVYYIIVDLNLSKKQINLLLKTILVLGLIQGYLVTIQYFAPPSFNNLFVPQDVNLETGGIAIQKSSEVSSGSLKTGAVNGTFANTANTSAFLLICFIIIIVLKLQNNSYHDLFLSKNLFNFVVMYFALFATYKRIALLFGMIIPVIILFIYRKRLWAGKVIWFYLFSLFLLIFASLFFLNVDTSIDSWAIRKGGNIDLLGYFGQLFSAEYWQKGTRQWIIKTIVGGTIGTGNWFGFSSEANEAVNTLTELLPAQKSIILERKFWFEDVYWGAMLLYYGIPGVALFGYIFQSLYKTAQWLINHCLERQLRSLGIVFCTLSIITIFYGFVERIFEMKCFSFYLWLLAGIVVNVYSRYWQQSERID